MYETCPSCHVKRNIHDAPICPVCPERMNKRFQADELATKPALYAPASVDAFLNQFPVSVFEYKVRRMVKEVATIKPIIRVLHDTYKWSFPRVAKLFEYSDHTTVMHLYNQR